MPESEFTPPATPQAFESREQEQSVEYWTEMTEAFRDPETLAEIQRFPDNVRDEIVGEAVRFMCIHKSADGLVDYLNKLHIIDYTNGIHYAVASEMDKAIVESIGNKLRVEDINSAESKRAIYDYFVKNYVHNGFYFHGFSGVFEEAISQNGLSNTERIWSHAELEEVSNIGAKGGNSKLLGWASINSQGKTFVSANPHVIYRYSVASPEWFAQFTAEGFHVPVENNRKKAFYYRDYELARQNILAVCDQMMDSSQEDIDAKLAYPNITSEEREKVISLFDKYWPILAGPQSKPMLALIKKSSIEPRAYHDLDTVCQSLRETIEAVDLAFLVDILSENMSVDMRIENPVSKTDIILSELPEYASIHPQ